jgi:hypothetical protein
MSSSSPVASHVLNGGARPGGPRWYRRRDAHDVDGLYTGPSDYGTGLACSDLRRHHDRRHLFPASGIARYLVSVRSVALAASVRDWTDRQRATSERCIRLTSIPLVAGR